MLLVVADTSPVRYLIQIDKIEVVHLLFQSVTLPSVVAQELRHPSAPAAVQAWMGNPPDWVTESTAPRLEDPLLARLDPGERAAIALGITLHADLILIDERKGASAARSKGLEVIGTLGVLDLAASRGLIDLKDSLERLKKTNFRYRPDLISTLLERHKSSGRT
jgi:predicted nucleic acid-binding protein